PAPRPAAPPSAAPPPERGARAFAYRGAPRKQMARADQDRYSRSAVEFFRLFPQSRGRFKLSTAARMSASFPYVSPAGDLPPAPPRAPPPLTQHAGRRRPPPRPPPARGGAGAPPAGGGAPPAPPRPGGARAAARGAPAAGVRRRPGPPLGHQHAVADQPAQRG